MVEPDFELISGNYSDLVAEKVVPLEIIRPSFNSTGVYVCVCVSVDQLMLKLYRCRSVTRAKSKPATFSDACRLTIIKRRYALKPFVQWTSAARNGLRKAVAVRVS